MGAGWSVQACPGEDPVLWARGVTLTVAEQDAGPLAEAILACAHDGDAITFDSCFAAEPHVHHEMTVRPNQARVEITATYGDSPAPLPFEAAFEVACALLAAAEHSVSGPCPRCGHGLADDHPANGCPQ